MKHRVTVEVEHKKHFFGIPYTVTEKETLDVSGREYRRMKKEKEILAENTLNREDMELLAEIMDEEEPGW